MTHLSTLSVAEDGDRFAFGRNWQDFAAGINEHRIQMAEAGLDRLIGAELIRGASFLDVGCGSGLHALAALRLGAARVTAIDVDPVSVSTARAVLETFGFRNKADIDTLSVFDATPEGLGQYDIVYSWGVLHHTGDLWRAVDSAIRLVRPGGLLAIAVYRKTPLCWAWAQEKRLYAAAPPWAQRVARAVFVGLIFAGLLVTGRSPQCYARGYARRRGMSFMHDVHDWLGGYPYESATAEMIDAFLKKRGLTRVRENLARRQLGVLGTGCSEYVYKKTCVR